MGFPIKVCVVCGEEFELRPGKPGYANRCPSCSLEEEEKAPAAAVARPDALELREEREKNAARRKVMRDMLYRKEG